MNTVIHNATRPIEADLTAHSLEYNMSHGDALRLLALAADMGWHNLNCRRHHAIEYRKEAPPKPRQQPTGPMNKITVELLNCDRGFPARVTIVGPDATAFVKATISARVAGLCESEGSR